MTVTLPALLSDDSPEPCGPDCIHLDGACRCHHGETTARQLGNQLLDSLIPPY